MAKTPKLYKNNFIKQPIVANTTFYNSQYNTFISGRVLEKDSKLVTEAIVTLFEAHSMTPVVAMKTYNQGFFRFLGLNPELEFLIVVKDRSGVSNYNAIIYDRIIPKAYNFIDETYLDFSIKPLRDVIEYPSVIVNENDPSSYLLNTFSFKLSGLYDSVGQGEWSTTDVLFQQLTTGVNGVFNGNTSQVTTTSVIPSLKFENDFTLSFFLKVAVVPQGASLGYPLISSNSLSLTDNDFFVIVNKDMKISLYKNNTILVTSITTLTTNTWFEVAIVREDDSRVSLFINGIKEAHADVSGLISFNNNGTCIGSSVITTYTSLNGTLQQIRTYSKAIYSRDYGVSSTLDVLQNFNPNLKVAIYFDSDNVQDIASNLPLEVNNVEVSSTAYYEGSSSGYFNGTTSSLSILPNEITDLSLQDDYTFEFAFQPDKVISASSGNFHVASIGEELHLEVRDNKLFFLVNSKEYACDYTLITHINFNYIRVSRKEGVVGVFINDVLQVKFISDRPQANSIVFGKKDDRYYKGWIDSVRFYYDNVYYDFNTDFRAEDPFKNNILNKLEFTDTYLPVDYTWMSFGTNGTLKVASDKCVEPPQSLYKLGTATVYTSDLLGYGEKAWTMEGWFCMGPIRSGNYYPLFDSSSSSQPIATYGFFVAIEASTSRLILYSGSLITGASQTQVYISDIVLNVGEWFHFAWEYNEVSSKLNCYLNFKLVYSLSTKSTLGFGNGTRIGMVDTNSVDYGFSGWIDSVYFYRGVAKYSTPVDRLWHPWNNSKNVIDLVYIAEKLNADRTLTTPQLISGWKEVTKSYDAAQPDILAQPLFKKGLTQEEDSLVFDGVDDFLKLRKNLDILYSKTSLWGYLVIKFYSISSTSPEKRILISATQYGSTENHTILELSLGDGISIENNNRIVLRAQGYSKANNSSYFHSTVISETLFTNDTWYTLRFNANFSNRLLQLFVNGSLDVSLSNAYRNGNGTIAWNTTDYWFGKTARNDDPLALTFKGEVNSLYLGSSTSTPSEQDFYKYDAYFKNKLQIPLAEDHVYYSTPSYIGNEDPSL